MNTTGYPYSFSDTVAREAAKLEELRKQVMGSLTGADLAYLKTVAEVQQAVDEPWRRLGISQRDWAATQGIMDGLQTPAAKYADAEYLDKLKRDLIGPSKMNEIQHLADTAASARKAIDAQGWWKTPEVATAAWQGTKSASVSSMAALSTVAARDEVIRQQALGAAARLEALRAPPELVIDSPPPFVAPPQVRDHGADFRRHARETLDLQRRQVAASEAALEQLREEKRQAQDQAQIERSRFRLTLFAAIAGVAATVLVFLVPYLL